MWSAFLSYSDDSGVSLSTKNKTGIHFYALWTVRFMFEALEELACNRVPFYNIFTC